MLLADLTKVLDFVIYKYNFDGFSNITPVLQPKCQPFSKVRIL